MLVYNYDKNGWYMGSRQANPDQKNKGKFLLPAFATFTAPPAPGPNQRAQWVKGAWQLGEDPFYTANQVVVFYSASGDGKILSSAPYGKVLNASGAIVDPAGAAHVVLPPGSAAGALNLSNVQTMKVASGKVVPRDPAAIAADAAADPALAAAAYKKATGKNFNPGAHAADMAQGLYHALNVNGDSTPEQMANAKAQLKTLAAAYAAIQATQAS